MPFCPLQATGRKAGATSQLETRKQEQHAASVEYGDQGVLLKLLVEKKAVE